MLLVFIKSHQIIFLSDEIMSVRIKEVQTLKDLKQFVLFPYKLYRNHSYWIPPLIKTEYDILQRKKNPAFDYCEAKYWLAYRDGKVVGRIAGIINNKFIEIWGRKIGGFGWFDVIDDRSVTETLFSTMEAWIQSKGMDGVHGPMGFTNFDRQGMLVEGFDELPTVASVYNYEYYAKHIEECGYIKETDYLEFEVKTPEAIPDKAIRIKNILEKKKGVRLLKLESKSQILAYAQTVFEIINKTYSHLFAFIPLNEQQIEMYTKKYFPFIQPDYVSLIKNKEDKVVGFQITMPSLSKAMQKAKGRLYPFGFLHLLQALKRPTKLDLYLVGILPEYQNLGLNAIFMVDLTQIVMTKGIKLSETNSELEDNKKVQDFWKYYDARQHKRKRIYIKKFVQ